MTSKVSEVAAATVGAIAGAAVGTTVVAAAVVVVTAGTVAVGTGGPGMVVEVGAWVVGVGLAGPGCVVGLAAAAGVNVAARVGEDGGLVLVGLGRGEGSPQLARDRASNSATSHLLKLNIIFLS